VLPLALGAMEVGTAASGAKTAGELEVVQVIHEARAASAIVVTDDPDRYTGHRLDVVDLRPSTHGAGGDAPEPRGIS
jgi:hypothetical protein